MNSNEKLMFFIYFHNFCAYNNDYLILFIKIGNAHKQRILSQAIIDAFETCEGGRNINTVKNYGGAQMVVVFTITEKNYFMVSHNVIWRGHVRFLLVVLNSLAALFAMLPA